MRERLLILLAGVEGLSVIGALEASTDAVSSVSMMRPDAVLVCIRAGDPDALSLLRDVKRERPATFLIALGEATCRSCRDRYLGAGADLYLDKADEFDQIAPALAEASKRTQTKGALHPNKQVAVRTCSTSASKPT